MSTRHEYDHDPTAPAANSLVVATSVIATNHDNQVLLVRRSDNDRWTIPGGAVEPGESVRQAAIRETQEESGYQITVTGLIGVYSDPGIVIAYADGEVRQQFSVCLTADITGGTPTPSSETTHVAWFNQNAITELDLSVGARIRLADYFGARPLPVIE